MSDLTVQNITDATNGIIIKGDPQTRITHISIDSRDISPGTLFIPLIGEKTDAHRFLPDVWDRGASACLTQKTDEKLLTGKTYIKVDDTLKALQDIAVYLRKNLDMPVIGITGSVGKTTTREMVAAALSAGYEILKTKANHNSQIGVPLTVFDFTEYNGEPSINNTLIKRNTSIAKPCRIGIMELGMSYAGEMEKISRIAKPDSAIITNIGVAHIEQLHSRENILAEKLKICSGMNDSGTLFLNMDDEMLLDFIKSRKTSHQINPNINIICFGCEKKKCPEGIKTYNYADNISFSPEGLASFTAHLGKEEIRIQLGIGGRHEIINAMAALSVSAHYSVDLRAAAKALSLFNGFEHRQQIFRHNGYTVIDDTYNASPDSVKAALDLLACQGGAVRKIAVLADMKELGENSVKLHEEIGEYIIQNHSADTVLVLGKLAKKIANITKNVLMTRDFSSSDELYHFLSEYIRPGDAVLVKGSNSMGLSVIADRLDGKNSQK